MIDVSDYVPVLYGKAAEYAALGDLHGRARHRTRPLLELAPRALDSQTEEPSKSVKDHLDRDVRYLREHWAAQQMNIFEDVGDPPVVMVDTRNLLRDHVEDGSHPLEYLKRHLTHIGVRMVPVTSFSHGEEHHAAVAAVAAEDGVCLRLDRNQWADPAQLAAETFALLTELGIGPESVDVVIDLGSIGEQDAPSALLLARGALQALPSVNDWRSLVVVGSSFPATVSDAVDRYGSSVVRRAEWEMYGHLIEGLELLPRVPTFGDYGIEGAAGVAGGVAPMFSGKYISASIRYTGLNGWFVVRGGRLQEDGKDQYHKLAAEIVDSAHWRSEEFSWGDGYIARCARHLEGPGTPQHWRRVAVNHHVTTVVEELASLLES